MELKIRHAEPGDFAAIQEIFVQPKATSGTLQTPYPSIDIWRERLSKMSPEFHLLVALVDGKLVGNAGLDLSTRRRRIHAAHIGMAVHDQYHNLGVGTALMAALIDQADNWLNLLRLELTVFTDNKSARRLYEKFGFVIEGTHVAYALRNGVYADVYAMARLHPKQPRIEAKP